MLPVKHFKSKTDEHNSTSEFNLIDLMDDVHITPTHENKEQQINDYQIKMLEEFLATSKLKCKKNELQDAELRSFFDKYECEQKPMVVASNSHLEAPSHKLRVEDLSIFEQKTDTRQVNAQSYNTVHNIDYIPKILVPRLENDDGDKINEDLIDEVMFEQHLEKQLMNATNNNIYKEIIQNSNYRNQGSDSESQKTVLNNKVQSLRPPGGLNTPLLFAPDLCDHNMPSDNSHIFNEIVTRNKIKHEKATVEKSIPEFTAKLLNVPIYTKSVDKDALDSKIKLEQKTLTEELATKYGIKYLETVKKVEKTFQKKSNLKSDFEKAKLIPGPSLYEKTVVLPQLMHRLNEKYQARDKSKMQMRLVLDAGQSHSIQFNKSTLPGSSSLNTLTGRAPEVLLADCNKERLKAFEAWKLFHNIVHTGTK